MIIPKNISIAGRLYEIKKSTKEMFKEGLEAQIRYREGIIWIIEPEACICKDHIEITFLHEVVHAILHAMDDNDNKDEKFVQRFAYFLHQVIKQLLNENSLGSSNSWIRTFENFKKDL